MTCILITGGAGFVGANLAITLATRHPDWHVIALDNLRRRGSELNLPRLRQAGVEVVSGDVRVAADLDAVATIDALVECSAEPSALAGTDGRADYAVQTNLFGAYHCINRAARDDAQLVFLSTSRVYPVDALNRLALTDTPTRFTLCDEQPSVGATSAGISEMFPLDGPRTLYGTTKLAAELLIAEYARDRGLRAVINRCGVIAGPWQMGKVDQGVFTHWLLSHHLRRPLTYIGYGGTGHQVRDLLHVADVVDLVEQQLLDAGHWDGLTVNVGGGVASSLSLLETTVLCQELTGNEVPISALQEARAGDVPVYLSDCAKLFATTSWRPARGARQILVDTLAWIREHEDLVVGALH